MIEVIELRDDPKRPFLAMVRGHHETGRGASAPEALRALADRLEGDAQPVRSGFVRTNKPVPAPRVEIFVANEDTTPTRRTP